MYGSKWIRIGAISGALGVSLGALGAHAVKSALEEKTEAGSMTTEVMSKVLENWSTATEYMMYHSIAIVLVGLVSAHLCSKLLTCAGSFFTAGIAGFSLGLLSYNILLITSGTKVIFLVAAVVPLGGVFFIVGWVCLAAALWTGKTCDVYQ
tara:strand:+ start:1782 stop:2234 length:453 start_codon:yes stop_codon:yes gene_type:complete